MSTIAGFARQGGVSVETVRFYQRRGLLEIPSRSAGGRRYGVKDGERLQFIRSAQSAGFTLEEIKELLSLDQSRDRARIQKLTRARIESLDQKITQLKLARDALAGLSRQCSASRSGPCPIIAAFRP
ncbi:MAG TPA: MerR family transcriptional regulator [Steroidobacteraceae bacterium]|jgi:MerR family mercuric resistance operon transcriptional regulator